MSDTFTRALGYDIVRRGDTVAVTHKLGTHLVPWARVAYADPA